jgi:phage repressor protein C with HTH and peptisase S24 domain
MRYPDIVRELSEGRSVTLKPHGNSMTPMIQSGQRIVLSPCKPEDVRVGDAALAKVKGRYFIHKVTAIGDDGRFQISNNHGHVNGWTRQVFGKVTQIGDGP